MNVCEELSKIEPSSQAKIQDEVTKYVSTCQELRVTLLNQIGNLMENNPYKTTLSAYATKKDTEISHLKTVLLSEILEDMKEGMESELSLQTST